MGRDRNTTQQAAPAVAGATGTTRPPRAAREKIERIDYVAPQGAAWADHEGKLTAWPDDFKSTTHKPLARKQFADERVWLLEKATQFDKKAVRFRQEAENVGKLGGIKDRSKAKKLLKMQQRMEDLKASLASEGVDINALLGTIAPADTAAAG